MGVAEARRDLVSAENMLQVCCKLQHTFEIFAIAQIVKKPVFAEDILIFAIVQIPYAEQEVLPAYSPLASSDSQAALHVSPSPRSCWHLNASEMLFSYH